MPCTDFTGWIVERLRENDIDAIKLLLYEFSSKKSIEYTFDYDGDKYLGHTISEITEDANDSDKNLIDKCLASILSINFEKYLKIDEKGIRELIAMFIMLSNTMGIKCFENGHRIFDDAKFINYALCVYPLDIIKESFAILIEKANRYVKSIEKEPPFNLFDSYARKAYSFGEKDLHIAISNMQGNKVVKILRELPISTRIHFFTSTMYLRHTKIEVIDDDLIDEKTENPDAEIKSEEETYEPERDIDPEKVISLCNTTFYDTRKMGIDIEKSAEDLYESGLFIKLSNEPLDYSIFIRRNFFSKSDIISLGNELDLNVKKTWTKSKILDCIISSDKGRQLLSATIAKNGICKFNTYYFEDLIALEDSIEKKEKLFKLLCFLRIYGNLPNVSA